MNINEERPNPEELLSAIKKRDKKTAGGELKIFFGMSAGVGKTYSMLQAGQEKLREGVDTVIGVVDTHGRKETEQLLEGYEIIPLKKNLYRGSEFYEMDLDAILERNPKLVLVDELAHTNIPGSRHPKRWQDVIELLDAGIDVYSTLNVQHLESRKDIVEGITGIPIWETVPDLVLERAVQIELVDLSPEDLLKRLKEGKVYLGEQSEIAARNFFQEDRLTALREIALRFTAEKVDHDLHELRLSLQEYGTGWKTTERLLVAISYSPFSQQLIRSARRIAFTLDAPWIGLYVDTGISLTNEEKERLESHMALARDLGAEVITIRDPDLVKGIQRIVKQRDVTQIIIGRPSKNVLKEFFVSSLIDKLTAELPDIDIHVVRQTHIPGVKKRRPYVLRPFALFAYWKVLACVLAFAILGHLTQAWTGYKIVRAFLLTSIVLLGLFANKGALFFAAILSSLIWYFYFVPVPGDIDDLAMIPLFFIVAGIMGSLVQRLQTNEILLKAHEEKTQAVYDIIKEIANAKSTQELMRTIEVRLGRLLQGNCEIVLANSEGQLVFSPKSLLIQDEKDKSVALWVYKSGKAAGWCTDTLPLVKNLYVPLKGYKEVVGVIAFQSKYGRKLNLEEINLIYNIAQNLANYLWRTLSEEKALKSEYTIKIERIHQAILKSLSYQSLPSPHLPEEREEMIHSVLPWIQRSKSLTTPSGSSKEIQRMVGNLLALTKSSDLYLMNKKLENVYTLIEACHIENFLSHHSFQKIISPNLPPVMMDFALMQILISNLIMKAEERSPDGSTITLTVSTDRNSLIIKVADRGSPIPENNIPTLFERFFPDMDTRSPGIGLGLAIAKNIAEAHQGCIRAHNLPEGGLEIIVEIPIGV